MSFSLFVSLCMLHSDLSLGGWLPWPESDTAPLMSDKPFSPSTILFCAKICLRWWMPRLVNNTEPCSRPDSLSNREAFALNSGQELAHTAAFLITMGDSVLAFMTQRVMEGRQTGEREKLTWAFSFSTTTTQKEPRPGCQPTYIHLTSLGKKLVCEIAVQEETRSRAVMWHGCMPCYVLTHQPIRLFFNLFAYIPNFSTGVLHIV